MEDPTIHDAASTLAHSKSSWVPFTTPGVSAAARKLAERSHSSSAGHSSSGRSAASRSPVAKRHTSSKLHSRSTRASGSRAKKTTTAKRSRSSR